MNTIKTQKFGWSSVKKNFKFDILSGFIVSLIALPLCLGVAAASNFPPITGVLTSIIGGLIIGFFSGSELAIKGPAAGLIVIVAGAVEEFGRGDIHQGYLLTASLIAVTGVAQIILGFLKIGKWADFIPSSIVHGMLAAIGIIIISKQIHLLIGITPEEIKGMHPLELIMHIPKSLMHLEWHVTLIGVFCLALLFLLPKFKSRFIKSIPPFLVVIVMAIVIAQIFHFSSEKKFYNTLINPGNIEFNVFFNAGIFNSENIGITLKYFFLLTIIGTIESMLTVKAVDLLDPYKRTSNYNKDVIAIGIGNFFSGILGAMPMISEVARSSANINNKAVTRFSTIMHGTFLMIFVLVFVSIIKLIPVAALSSILIFVGYRLANPKDFLRAFKISNEHFIVFLTTTVVTLVEDLLVGVLAGIILKMLINFIKSGELRNPFASKLTIEHIENKTIIHLDSAAVFTNWLGLKKHLQHENGKKIVIDFSNVRIADSSFIDNIYRYKENYPHEFVLKGFQELYSIKNHPHSLRIRSEKGGVITIKLSKHQQLLKEYCDENNFIISFSTVIPKNYLADFKQFKHSDIRQTDVYITGTKGGMKFEYFESLVYDSVNMLDYRVNNFSIDFGNGIIPKFMLQKESKLDTVIELFAKNQVIFENHNVFNSSYSLFSRDSERVKSIFNDEIIDFFENRDISDIIIEGNNTNKLIISDNGKPQGTDAFEFKLEIATKFHTQFVSISKSKLKTTVESK